MPFPAFNPRLGVGQKTPEPLEELRPKTFRSLSSKFSIFTGLVVFWVVATILGYDLREERFDVSKGIVLCLVVMLVAAMIARFTLRLLARPLALLQAGITSVRDGRLEPIQVSRTGDEIEYLGESFNGMIQALASSQEEIRQHQELLEERIRQRTEEFEQAMHRALAASQAKSEFLANISHELRTPMNGVIGMIDVVMDSRLTPEQREQLETAQRCAYSLLALLNDILDLSKIEAGKMVLEKIPFDLRHLVEDCVKGHAPKAAQKGIHLFTNIAAGVPQHVLGDPLRLRQILTNLLSNAVKFTERGSVRVELETRQRTSRSLEIQLQVTDTGAGIPADKLSSIFDKFTQADGSISRKYGGTGLGLAITQRLVAMYGGDIRVQSELGHGSTFFVTVLCETALLEADQEEKAGSLRSSPSAPSTVAGPPARILIVEDNIVNQKVVTAMLKKKRYLVAVANDGQEAIECLERTGSGEAFDLVLMDVQMPVLDGLEATRAIRRDERWNKLPIVAMTAHAMNGDRERCLEAGMNGYVSKPVNPAHLLATVEQFLSPLAPENTRAENRPAPSPIERALAARLMATDSDLVDRMLHLFLQLAPERLQKLESAIERSDAQALSAEAHRIEAAARSIAAAPVTAAARQIEQSAQAADFDSARAQLANLAEAIRNVTQQAAVPAGKS